MVQPPAKSTNAGLLMKLFFGVSNAQWISSLFASLSQVSSGARANHDIRQRFHELHQALKRFGLGSFVVVLLSLFFRGLFGCKVDVPSEG